MAVRVALIDSGCDVPGLAPVAACRFRVRHGSIEVGVPGPDPTGHGTRIALILTGGRAPIELLVAQVFESAAPAAPAAVAAAVDWCVAQGARLLHLSLGLKHDRPVLRAAVERACTAGCVVVAATPARGGAVYPADYGGVIGGTGDARCAPGEISALGHDTFGGCVQGATRGASVGAAWVSRALLELGAGTGGRERALLTLAGAARYHGRERRAGHHCPEGQRQ